jgi:hypothetical protein
MQIDRHPAFVAYLRSLPRTDVALHGLHHTHPRRKVPVEFQEQDVAQCGAMLREAMSIFQRAGLAYAPGMTPPGFDAPKPLLQAMADVGLRYISSARDIRSPIAPDAVGAMTGLRDLSLIYPERLPEGLVHIPVNFQATCTVDRALAILDQGGVLSIKAHIIKNCLGFIALDGLDALYTNYLDTLFATLGSRYGEGLWWTSMAAIADRMNGSHRAGDA